MSPPITEDNVEDYATYYNQTLGGLIEGGMPYSEACEQAQLLALKKFEQLEYYLGEYATPEEIKIRKVIPLHELEELTASKNAGGWNNLPKEERNTILFNLGLSVHKAGWWEEVGNLRIGTQVVLTKYILSEERLDKAWTNLIIEGCNVASFDAIVMASGDKSLERELRSISR